MVIDFSLLENINFANRDNLIFLAIIFVLAIIVFSLFLFIAAVIVKRIKKMFAGIFHGRVRKTKKEQAENVQQQTNAAPQDSSHRVESFGNVGGGSKIEDKKESEKESKQEYKQSYEAKEQKEISEGLSKLKSAPSSGEGTVSSKMPSREEKQGKGGGNEKFYAENSSQSSTEDRDLTGQREADRRGIKIPTAQNFKEAAPSEKIAAGEKPGTEQGYKQKYEVKEKKDIVAGLSKLKSVAPSKEGTVSSKMPSREENQEGDDRQQINIPVSKHFKAGDDTQATLNGENLTGQDGNKQAISPFEKPGFVEDKYGVHSAHNDNSKVSPQAKSEQGEPIFEKPGFVEDKYGVHAANEARIAQKIKNDDSIFKGESEVSRIKLESEMKSDPKVWQASKQSGLNMSPVERSKLVKEIFPSALGLNISKADVKTSIRRLNQKLSGATDPAEHGKIRKEIKFLKKIGGIK